MALPNEALIIVAAAVAVVVVVVVVAAVVVQHFALVALECVGVVQTATRAATRAFGSVTCCKLAVGNKWLYDRKS